MPTGSRAQANTHPLDYLAIGNVAFEWAQSYDTKDWARLHKILAPSIRLDVRPLHGALHESLTPDEYVAILSSPSLIGDKELMSQHLLGQGRWERLGDDSVTVMHQIRVAHQRYSDESFTTVVNHGHSHATVQHWYRRFEGGWKLEGVLPQLGWSEYDLFGTLHPDRKGGA